MPELGTIDRRQTPSLPGVAPFGRHSGRRCIRGGRAKARHVAMRSACKPVGGPLGARSEGNLRASSSTGQACRKVAPVAVMRKRTCLPNALPRDDRLRQPEAPARPLAAVARMLRSPSATPAVSVTVTATRVPSARQRGCPATARLAVPGSCAAKEGPNEGREHASGLDKNHGSSRASDKAVPVSAACWPTLAGLAWAFPPPRSDLHGGALSLWLPQERRRAVTHQRNRQEARTGQGDLESTATIVNDISTATEKTGRLTVRAEVTLKE